MSRRREDEGVPAPLLDMAWTVALIFLAFVLISIVRKPTESNGVIIPKAEFMITMDWDDYSRQDIDLYVRGPDGKVVFFKTKETPLMFLDTDNLAGDKDLRIRREIVTIRQLKAGSYIVNVHYYDARDHKPTPTNVRLNVMKINPVQIVADKYLLLDNVGQEVSVVGFKIDDAGNVIDIFETDERFVYITRAEAGLGPR